MLRTLKSLVGLILVPVLAGCAAAPPLPPPRDVRPTDVPGFAGEWDAATQVTDGIGVARARHVIRQDGTLTVVGVASGAGPGRIWVEGGKLRLESVFADAALTLYEGEGRRVLRGPGILRGTGREIEIELTQARR